LPAPAADTVSTYFLPFQAAWLRDKSGLRIMEKGRQIGLSYSTSYGAVTDAATGPHDVWVSSRDDFQAKLFIRDCQKWSSFLQIAAADLGQVVVSDDGQHSASVLEFASGCRIYSLSSNPNALAGKRGHVILDEFALHKDQRLLYRIAKPVTQWGGQLSIISTHRGAGTVFNEIIRDIQERGNPMGWSHHRVTIQDAVASGIVEKINAKAGRAETREGFLARMRRECLDEEQWLQEYCCQPVDDATAFLGYELIAGCFYAAGEEAAALAAPLESTTHPLFVGVDVGRDHDLTVIWVFEKVAGVFFTRRVIELKAQTFEAQERELGLVLSLPGVRRCCIDSTGIGRQFAERAQKRFGTYKVEQVHFTGPVKEELAFPLRAAFEDKALRLPRSEALMTDLRSIRKETTAAGNIRFGADRGKNGHADRFWALALALHAGKSPGAPLTIRNLAR
jgi:phage FluMu gp28-like protein